MSVDPRCIWARDISSTIDELERIHLGVGPLAGRLDPGRIAVLGHPIVCDYARAFLDRYLQGRNGSLLDGPSSEYPKVEIRVGRR